MRATIVRPPHGFSLPEVAGPGTVGEVYGARDGRRPAAARSGRPGGAPRPPALPVRQPRAAHGGRVHQPPARLSRGSRRERDPGLDRSRSFAGARKTVAALGLPLPRRREDPRDGPVRPRPAGSAAPLHRRAGTATRLAFCPPADRESPEPEPRAPRQAGEHSRGARRHDPAAGDYGRRALATRPASGESASPMGPTAIRTSGELSMLIERLGPLEAPLPNRRRSCGRSGVPAGSLAAGGTASRRGRRRPRRRRGPGRPVRGAHRGAARRPPVPDPLRGGRSRRGTDAELREALDKLRAVGVDVPTAEVFRTLGRSVPPWPVSSPPDARRAGALVGARVGDTARCAASSRFRDDQEEVGKPVQRDGRRGRRAAQPGLARAGVPHVRRRREARRREPGEPARPWTRRGARPRRPSTSSASGARRGSRNHEALAPDPLVLPGLTPIAELIKELRDEEKRERRRLLLSLLEIHGAGGARDGARRCCRRRRLPRRPSRTGTSSGTSSISSGSIPRARRRADRRRARRARPPSPTPRSRRPLVKEAIAGLGTARHEQVRGGARHDRPGARGDAREEGRRSVRRGRAAAASRPRRLGARALRKRHVAPRSSSSTASSEREGSGTPARVSPSCRARISRTIPTSSPCSSRALRAELPFKVFGLTLKKRDDKIGPIIEALSGRRLPQVRKAFEEIVEQPRRTPTTRRPRRGRSRRSTRRRSTPRRPASLFGRSRDLRAAGAPPEPRGLRGDGYPDAPEGRWSRRRPVS